MEPTEKSFTEIEGIVKDAIAQAVDFVESEITHERIKAQRYFDGEVDIGYEQGRSGVVATKVRDTVRAVKPSLMRVFMSTARPVEFIPRGPEDVAFAEQASDYMHYVFQKNNGFRVLNDAFHDALVKKQGVVKAYWETKYNSETFTITDLTQEERDALLNELNITLIEETMTSSVTVDESGAEVELPTYSVKVSKITPEGNLRIESVPIDPKSSSLMIRSSLVFGRSSLCHIHYSEVLKSYGSVLSSIWKVIVMSYTLIRSPQVL